jgi:hypothetical protein
MKIKELIERNLIYIGCYYMTLYVIKNAINYTVI